MTGEAEVGCVWLDQGLEVDSRSHMRPGSGGAFSLLSKRKVKPLPSLTPGRDGVRFVTSRDSSSSTDKGLDRLSEHNEMGWGAFWRVQEISSGGWMKVGAVR